MKKLLTLLLATIFLATTQTAQAQSGSMYPTDPQRICFNDGYYDYLFTNITTTGTKTLYATGSVIGVGNGTWTAELWVDFSAGGKTGTVEVHAVNPLMDGCTGGYTDSFIYTGNMTINYSGGVRTYSGGGGWTSFCSGSVFGTGTWYASGPCGAPGLVQNGTKPSDKNPAMTTGAGFKMNVAPNPVRNNTNISYKIPKTSSVNITIYNMMNQPVKVLVNENQSAGAHVANWTGVSNTGTKVPNGIYKVVAIVNGKPYSETIQVIQ